MEVIRKRPRPFVKETEWEDRFPWRAKECEVCHRWFRKEPMFRRLVFIPGYADLGPFWAQEWRCLRCGTGENPPVAKEDPDLTAAKAEVERFLHG